MRNARSLKEYVLVMTLDSWLRVSALALPLTFARCATAQNGPPVDLDAYVALDMKTFDVPGIAIAIVKDGKVVLRKA